MPRPKRAAPRDSSPDWPKQPCTDVSAEFMRQVALRLRVAIANRSVRSVAAEVGVVHTTIGDILSGTSWVEAATIERLERGLGVALWPQRFDAPRRKVFLPNGQVMDVATGDVV